MIILNIIIIIIVLTAGDMYATILCTFKSSVFVVTIWLLFRSGQKKMYAKYKIDF